MNENKIKFVLAEGCCFVLQFVFSAANILGVVFPVGLPFAFARIFFGSNILFVAGEYALSKVLLFGSLKWIIVTAFEIIMISLLYFSNEFFKVKNKNVRVLLFGLVSKMPELYFLLEQKTNVETILIGVALTLLLSVYFLRLFVSFKNKAIFFKFARVDYFLFSVFVLFLSFGVFSFDFVAKNLYLFFIALPVILLCRTVEPEKSLVNSCLFALGFSVVSGRFQVLGFAIALAVFLVAFRQLNKYLYALAFSIFCIVLCIFFDFLSIFELISVYFAVLLFILIPDGVMKKVSAMFDMGSEWLIEGEILKFQANQTKEKLELMATTFASLKNELMFLIVGKIDRQKAAEELSKDVIAKCCKTCENFKICFGGNIQKKKYFDLILSKAFENKKVGFDDVSLALQSYCSKTGIIVSEINQISNRFLGYERAMKNEDTSKLLVANELDNFSDIFSNFAKLINFDCKINKKSSKNVKELFIKSFFDVKEVAVYENENGICSVSVVALSGDVLKKEFADVIFSVTKIKMEIEEVKHLNYSGISFAKFVPASKLKIDFAISSKAKERSSGDNATVLKISKNKYMVAITDGMGHGEQANKISSMVLSVFESMFKVGLDDELILESVNKLLIPAGLDNFSTLDCLILDLELQVAEFIKLGASVSVMKSGNKSETIECSSLPVGIVQNVKPTIIKRRISVGDIIILASDGVVDSFRSVEEYKNFINDSQIFNLKSYTDSLIFDASYQNQTHPDDMTVIAINLLKK